MARSSKHASSLAELHRQNLELLAALLDSGAPGQQSLVFLLERNLAGAAQIAMEVSRGMAAKDDELSGFAQNDRMLAALAEAPMQRRAADGKSHIVAIGFRTALGLRGGAFLRLDAAPSPDFLERAGIVAQLGCRLVSNPSGITAPSARDGAGALQDRILELAKLSIDAYWEADADGNINRIQILSVQEEAKHLLALDGRNLKALLAEAARAGSALPDEMRAQRITIEHQGAPLVAEVTARKAGADAGWQGLARLIPVRELASEKNQRGRMLIDMAEDARYREDELRRETEIMIDALRVLTNGKARPTMFTDLLAALAPGLSFAEAVVLQQDWSGEIAAVAATEPAMLAESWSSFARIFRSEDVSAGVFGIPDGLDLPPRLQQTFGWKRALAIKLEGGAKSSFLLCFYDGERVGAKLVGLGRRFGLVAAQALMNEEERQKVVHTSKLAAVGEMAAGIVHEINQPLGAISLALENLRIASETGVLTREALDKKLGHLENYMQRVGRIVGSIRKLAHTSDDASEIFDVKEAVEEATAIVEHRLRHAGIALSLQIEDGLHVVGSRQELAQVIINFLSNSIDAISAARAGAGEAREADIIRLSAEADGVRIKLWLHDSGGGFSDKALEHALEPFFTTKKTGQGMGLGLALCHRIIKNMGGEITLGNWVRGAEIGLDLKRADLQSQSARSAQKA